MQQNFWDGVWSRNELFKLEPSSFAEAVNPSDRLLLTLMGDLQGKRVLDLGCGGGELSVYAARKGARVTAVDASQAAADATRALAKHNGVGASVRALKADAMEIDRLGTSFDLVFGRFILHHIEPLSDFAAVLNDVLAPGGRGLFSENNANNPLLMFSRKFLAGRFGIPKYGDEEEYPLEPREIAMLREHFAAARVHYAEFVFFAKLNTYLFRQQARFRPIMRLLTGFDTWIYNHHPALHPYSYHQVVELEKEPHPTAAPEQPAEAQAPTREDNLAEAALPAHSGDGAAAPLEEHPDRP